MAKAKCDRIGLFLKAFPPVCKLCDDSVDGECSSSTLNAPGNPVEAHDDVNPMGRIIRIGGGNCFIRAALNTDGKKPGAATRGRMPYGGEDSDNGWLQVLYRVQKVWVSGKCGRAESRNNKGAVSGWLEKVI